MTQISLVSRSNFYRGEKGTAAVLVPGGALEALNSDPDRIRLVLNRRKGFIKLALRYGIDLVPTFSFGENFIYDQVRSGEGKSLVFCLRLKINMLYLGSRLKAFQTWAEKWIGFTPVIFFGRGIFQYNYGLIPHRKPIHVVVGRPIIVEKCEAPTKEQIADLHKQYVEALNQLYTEYNPKYGNPDIKLVIE